MNEDIHFFYLNLDNLFKELLYIFIFLNNDTFLVYFLYYISYNI